MPDAASNHSTVDISWSTIRKVLIAIVLVWVWLKVWILAMVMLISILIAVGLDPVVRWLEARGIPRWLGSTGCILVLAAGVGSLVMQGWSTISQQGRLIALSLSTIYQHLLASFPVLERVLPGSSDAGRATLQEYGTALA